MRSGATTAFVAVAVAVVAVITIINGPATRGTTSGNGQAITEQRQSASAQSAASKSVGREPLIGPRGSKELTRTQLRAFVQSTFDTDDHINAALWEQQQWLAMQCMADAGYLFDPTAGINRSTSAGDGLTPTQRDGYYDTLGGKGASTPYTWRIEADWRTAGCVGRAVHATDPNNAS